MSFSKAVPFPPQAQEAFDIGSTEDSLERMERCFHQLGDTFRVHAPGRRSETWVICNPEDVKRVLVSNHRNYTKGVGLDRVRILLGNGIMVSEGEFWRRQRRMIQPAFHRRVIERFATVVAAANRRHLTRWDALARSGATLNLTADMSELTLDIVLNAIFGEDLERLRDEHGDNPFAVVTREPARNLQFAFRFRSLARLVVEIVRRRQQDADDRHFDFVTMLMSARDGDTGEPMSERELVDEIMTLVVAGHETTASALNWTWYLLAGHPEVEAKLHAELDARGELQDLSLKTMESLTYVQQVIHEALRLYPPGWLITRRSIGPDRIGGFELPAGADVFLSPYLLHRHPAHWQDPDEFRPERFTAEAEAARHRYAYIPFVAGPRHCVGETFALYEMAMHLQDTARRFRLRHRDDGPIELEALINLRTKRDLYVTVERR